MARRAFHPPIHCRTAAIVVRFSIRGRTLENFGDWISIGGCVRGENSGRNGREGNRIGRSDPGRAAQKSERNSSALYYRRKRRRTVARNERRPSFIVGICAQRIYLPLSVQSLTLFVAGADRRGLLSGRRSLAPRELGSLAGGKLVKIQFRVPVSVCNRSGPAGCSGDLQRSVGKLRTRRTVSAPSPVRVVRFFLAEE